MARRARAVRAPKAKCCSTSCGTSSAMPFATSCAASFTCSSFTCHLKAGFGGGMRVLGVGSKAALAADRTSSGVGLASGSPRAAAYLFFLKGCVRRVRYVPALHLSTATATGPALPTKGFERPKSAWRDDEKAFRVGLTGCARDQLFPSWGSLLCSAQVRCGAQPGATILGRVFQKKKAPPI